ncbi:hypothetical protein CMV_026952, partial [Castanea mollissima]
ISHCAYRHYVESYPEGVELRTNGFLPMALFDLHLPCVPVSTNFFRALT